MSFQQKLAKQQAKKVFNKYRAKEYTEKWADMRRWVIPPLAGIVQVVTAVCAAALPAYAVQLLTGSWQWGFFVGTILIGAFEVLKRMFVDGATQDFYANGKLGFLNVVGFIAFGLASPASSYFGTPILVEEFAEMPTTTVDSIVQRFDSTAAKLESFWTKQQKEATGQADLVHTNNKATNEQGQVVTAYRVAPVETSLRNVARSAMDSLGQQLSQLEARKAKAIEQASKEHKEATAMRQQEKAALGGWLALVTLLFDLGFIACFLWLNYYDYKLFIQIYGEGAAKLPKKVATKPQLPKDFQKAVKAPESGLKAPKLPLEVVGGGQEKAGAFLEEGGRKYFEGDVLDLGGKPHIVCLKSNGEAKAYPRNQLSSLIGQGGGRTDYWQKMQDLMDSKT